MVQWSAGTVLRLVAGQAAEVGVGPADGQAMIRAGGESPTLLAMPEQEVIGQGSNIYSLTDQVDSASRSANELVQIAAMQELAKA